MFFLLGFSRLQLVTMYMYDMTQTEVGCYIFSLIRSPTELHDDDSVSWGFKETGDAHLYFCLFTCLFASYKGNPF